MMLRFVSHTSDLEGKKEKGGEEGERKVRDRKERRKGREGGK